MGELAMPKGPRGEKRPGDVVGCAVKVAQIASGEVEEELPSARRNGGLKGGPRRAEVLSAERQSEIGRKAAQARWSS